MNILISGGLNICGPQTHITNLCKYLLQRSVAITIVSTSTDWSTRDIAKLKKSGVHVIVSPFGFGAFRHLGKIYALVYSLILLQQHYDVLYCIGHGRMHFWVTWLAKKAGRKIYHEIAECPKLGSAPALLALKMTNLIGNSRCVSDKMSNFFPDIPVARIPFLTSEGPMIVPERKTVGRNTILRIAFLGRIVSHKHPGRLIDEWPALCRSATFSPARLDLYGGDFGIPLISLLREKVKQLGLENEIHFHGEYKIEQLPEILAQTDLVVLPSEYEGLPLVLVEAMLRGIPIVSTSAGGCAELGEENPDVIITPGTSWEAFSVGLLEMVNKIRQGKIDPLRLHAWAEKRYGFSVVSAKWIKVLLNK